MLKYGKFVAVMLLLIMMTPMANASGSKLFAAHSNGEHDDCFTTGEYVHVVGKGWSSNANIDYFIISPELVDKANVGNLGTDYLVGCYLDQTCKPYLNVLVEGQVQADGDGDVGLTNTSWRFPFYAEEEYRLLAFKTGNQQDQQERSNDSFGTCQQEIPEFPLILLPAGIILGFFFWKRK